MLPWQWWSSPHSVWAELRFLGKSVRVSIVTHVTRERRQHHCFGLWAVWMKPLCQYFLNYTTELCCPGGLRKVFCEQTSLGNVGHTPVGEISQLSLYCRLWEVLQYRGLFNFNWIFSELISPWSTYFLPQYLPQNTNWEMLLHGSQRLSALRHDLEEFMKHYLVR